MSGRIYISIINLSNYHKLYEVTYIFILIYVNQALETCYPQ